jgi:hypothetical protein
MPTTGHESSYTPRPPSAESSPAVDYGEAESTMGITRKVLNLNFP